MMKPRSFPPDVRPSFIGMGMLLVAVMVICSGCPSQEIVSLSAIEKNKIYIVGRIIFDNFQIEEDMLPGGEKICFVFFTKRKGQYLGMTQGLPASMVQAGWSRYFAHSLDRYNEESMYYVRSIFIPLQKDKNGLFNIQGDNYELLVNLSFTCGPEDSCLYIGDIVFTLRKDDMFVAVRDGYQGAVDYFHELWRKGGHEEQAVLKKRLLEGDDFVEIRKTVVHGDRYRMYPAF